MRPLDRYRLNPLPELLDLDVAADRKVVAERKWRAPLQAPKPQQPCDVGLFSDEANQLDLIEMFQHPLEE